MSFGFFVQEVFLYYDVNIRSVYSVWEVLLRHLCDIMNFPSLTSKFSCCKTWMFIIDKRSSWGNCYWEWWLSRYRHSLWWITAEKRTCITERCNVTTTNVIAGQVIDVEILTKYCVCSNINNEEHSMLSHKLFWCVWTRLFEIPLLLYNVRYQNYYHWDEDTKSYKTIWCGSVIYYF